jgi:2-keto-4-pentenoate hydratase
VSTAALHQELAGDIVLPGAVRQMMPVQPGDVFRAEFAHLGAVAVRFSKEGTA